MRIKTQRSLSKDSGHEHVVRLAIESTGRTGYLVAGLAIGAVCGFLAGSAFALSLGDKSLLLAQNLWERLSGVDSDGERVHFELLLQ